MIKINVQANGGKLQMPVHLGSSIRGKIEARSEGRKVLLRHFRGGVGQQRLQPAIGPKQQQSCRVFVQSVTDAYGAFSTMEVGHHSP